MINSNLGPISHWLARIARNGLQGHPSNLTGYMQVPESHTSPGHPVASIPQNLESKSGASSPSPSFSLKTPRFRAQLRA